MGSTPTHSATYKQRGKVKNIKHIKTGKVIKIDDASAEKAVRGGKYIFCSKEEAGFVRRKEILRTMRGSK